MRLSIGSDHAGFFLKPFIISAIQNMGHDIYDQGCYEERPVDFPDIAKKVCWDILNGKAEKGIMICGTGVGAAIACNKIPGIRASVCHDIYTSHQCVEHDDVNVLCLGAQIIGPSIAEEMIREFLQAKFSNSEEFVRRIEKLNQIDLEFRKLN